LTDVARECYELEMDRRQLGLGSESDSGLPSAGEPEVEPDWIDSAAPACSFQVGQGRRYAEDAERACAILRNAGVPSRVISEHEEGVTPDHITVIVPGALSLKAASVLDRDLFNEEMEENWRTHFELLSDEDLLALRSEDLCAGLLDRAARLKRVYEESLE